MTKRGGTWLERVTPARVSALVVAAAVVWEVFLLSRSYYYVDDFLRLREAATAPLGWRYLSMSVFGHFVPGWRLTFAALWRATQFSYWPVIVATAALQGATLVAIHRLVTAAVRQPWAAPVACVLYAASPALLETDYWFANALHVMPSLCLTLFGVDGFVRYLRTGRRRALAVSVPCACAGLLFYEKPVLALAFMPSLVVALAARDSGLGAVPAALVRVVRLAPVWALYTVPMGVYFAYYETHGYGGVAQGFSLRLLVAAEWRAWFGGLGPTFAGGPYRFARGLPGIQIAHAVTWVQVLGTAVVAAAIVVSVARDRRAAVGWVFAAAAFAISFGVVAAGRLTPSSTGISYDYRYTSDALPWVLLGAMIAFAGGAGPSPRQRLGRRGAAAVVVALLGAYTAGGVTNAVSYRAEWNSAMPSSYLSTAIGDLRAMQRDHRPFSLIDDQVPSSVALLGSYPNDLTSAYLPLVVPGLRFDDPTLPLYVVERSDGHVIRAHVADLAGTASPGSVRSRPALAAGRACSTGGAIAVDFPKPLPFQVYTLHATLVAAAPAAIGVETVSTLGAMPATVEPLPIGAGVHRVMTPLPPLQSSAATLTGVRLDVPPGPPVCLTELGVGLPATGP